MQHYLLEYTPNGFFFTMRYYHYLQDFVDKTLSFNFHNNVFFRTDNSIKNHWNSSLKRKLDFYLATGKLPQIPKSETRSATKDLPTSTHGPLFDCSNKRSMPSDGIRSRTKYSDNYPLQTSLVPQKDPISPHCDGFISCDATDCHLHQPITDTSCISYDTKSRMEECGDAINNERYYDLMEGSHHHTFGSLYNEPPQLDIGNSHIDSSLLIAHCSPSPADNSGMQAGNLSSFINVKTSSGCSPEYILENALKYAARSFPNTPSIFLRKRKREGHALHMSSAPVNLCEKIEMNVNTPMLPDTDLEQDMVNTVGSSCTQIKKESKGNWTDLEQVGSTVRLTLNSPQHSDEFEKNQNASPSYSLRPTRTAVTRSIEKKLEFAMDENSSRDSIKLKDDTTVNENYTEITSCANSKNSQNGEINELLVALESLSSKSTFTEKTAVS